MLDTAKSARVLHPLAKNKAILSWIPWIINTIPQGNKAHINHKSNPHFNYNWCQKPNHGRVDNRSEPKLTSKSTSASTIKSNKKKIKEKKEGETNPGILSIWNSTPSRARTNISLRKGTGIPLGKSWGFKAISSRHESSATSTKKKKKKKSKSGRESDGLF